MTGLLFSLVTLLLTSENVHCFLGKSAVKPSTAVFSYLDNLSKPAAPVASAPASSGPASFGNYLSTLGSQIPVQKVENNVVLLGKESAPAASTANYLSTIGAAKPVKKAAPNAKPVASTSSGGYLSQLGGAAPAAPVAPAAPAAPAAPVAPAASSAPVASDSVSLAAGATGGYLSNLSAGHVMAAGSSGPAGYLDVLPGTGHTLAAGASGPAGYLDVLPSTGHTMASGAAGPAGYLDALSPKTVSPAAPVSYAPHKGNVVEHEGNDLASDRHNEIMNNLKIILANQEEMKKDISSLLKNSGIESSAKYTAVPPIASTSAAPASAASAPAAAKPVPVASEVSLAGAVAGYLSDLSSSGHTLASGASGPAGYLDVLPGTGHTMASGAAGPAGYLDVLPGTGHTMAAGASGPAGYLDTL